MPPRSMNPRSVLGAKMFERGGNHNELTQQYPGLSGFLESALMGAAPDELDNASVFDPLTAERRKGAEYGYPVGIGAQVAPLLGPLARFGKGVAMAPNVTRGGRMAQHGVIKSPGGNWLSGSVEDALKGLKTPGYRHVNDEGFSVAEGYGRPMTAEELITRGPKPPQEAINNWIDKQLTRYVKNDMATEKDPIRALAERGVLHVNPEQLNFRPELHGKYMEPGQTAVAQSPTAKSWEGASDLKVHSTTPRQILGNDSWLPTELDTRIESNPWLAKVPPDTPVHGVAEPRSLPADLGFNHLIDELRSATNPASGLPADLLLKYESLPQVSVPQAVERVAKINAWREAQKVEANAAKANNAATVLHKDYPDKGFKWVELKQPSAKSIEELTPDQASWYQEYLQGGVSPDKALSEASKRGNKSLEDALKYEGDTMGHCVGNYCPDVTEGRSRIFSLRDSKGQPHTTIEVAPGGTLEYDPDAGGEAVNALDRIVQIKGKANRAPNPEYLPYVQDFVKSGKWSDVGDLQNTELTDIAPWRQNVLREGADPAAAEEFFTGLGHDRYVTKEALDAATDPIGTRSYGYKDLADYINTLKHPTESGYDPSDFARGGVVAPQNQGYNPDRVARMADALAAELFTQ